MNSSCTSRKDWSRSIDPLHFSAAWCERARDAATREWRFQSSTLYLHPHPYHTIRPSPSLETAHPLTKTTAVRIQNLPMAVRKEHAQQGYLLRRRLARPEVKIIPSRLHLAPRSLHVVDESKESHTRGGSGPGPFCKGAPWFLETVDGKMGGVGSSVDVFYHFFLHHVLHSSLSLSLRLYLVASALWTCLARGTV